MNLKSELMGVTMPLHSPSSTRLQALAKLTTLSLLLTLLVATVRGQSALDGFDPNANGEVIVVVVQPDGKILLGGTFTSLSPNGGAAVTRNRLARLNPDGTLDTLFNPNASGNVLSIAVQADGKVLAGGTFTTIGGQTRNNIARLDGVTGAADSFDPNANSAVSTIAVQGDGKVLAGGDFVSIGGQTRNRIARLDATTGLADSFDPNANGSVLSVVVQGDGKILVGGVFSGANSIGGQTRNRLARLDPTTGLADSWDPNASGYINAIVVQTDGKILVGGFFIHFGGPSIGGQPRNHMARLDPTTGLADSFNPDPNEMVQAIAVQSDGKVLVGGWFRFIGGQPRRGIARLNATTGLPDSFDPRVDPNDTFENRFVNAIALQPDGKVLAGGNFIQLGPNGGAPVTRNRIARLETNGMLDQTLLDLGPLSDLIQVIAVQPDGKILIGGRFHTILGVTRNSIARLNVDGSLDMGFNPNANNNVTAIAVQSDGKILVGGLFSGTNSIGGQTRDHIARLDGTTGLADSFNPDASSAVSSFVVQPEGKILVSGFFTNIGGQTRNYIARLDAVTGLADSFNPNANLPVPGIAVQADGKILAAGQFSGPNSIGGATRNFIARLDPTTGLADSFNPNADASLLLVMTQADGKILVSGSFSSIGGATRNRIARLDPTTGLADSFNPNANDAAFSMAVQADGKILVSGGFTNIAGQTRHFIARLDATGSADSFDPNASAGVNSIALQADGKILAGGSFFSIGGQSRHLFARLTNNTAVGQELAVTQGTITWRRSGSGVQFARVAFESSTDNVNYAPLGNGTANGSNWNVTGLNLPMEQNIYIRASGYYGTGQSDGSESITEVVRNAFLVPPAITSGNTTTFAVGSAGSFTFTTTGSPTGAGMSITASGALPGGVTFINNNNGTATLAGTPNAGTGGNYSITITASNGVSPNATQSFTLTVNQPPDITSPNGTTFTRSVPGTFLVTTTGFPTGANMAITQSGALPAGVTFTNNNNGSATLAGTPGAGTAGTYPLIFTANNGVAPSATQNFTLTVVAATPTPTPTPGASPTTLGNISTRLRVETGDNILIGGFIVTGTQPKKIIVRAIGPSLPLSGALADPVLELRNSSGALIRSNDNWRDDSAQESEILATGIPPSNDLESAIVETLPANGSAYTAIVRGANNGTGIGVVEAYDLDQTANSKLANISTRGFVQTGDDVLIGGLIVLGQNPLRVIVRAIGPSLPFPGTLADPTLNLHDGNGTLVASNNNWRDDPAQESEIIATGIPPSNDLESAMVHNLTPGSYTAIVRGVKNTTGIAVVEAYSLN